MQCVVLDGGLCNTAIFRHFGGRIRGVEGVYRLYIRGIDGVQYVVLGGALSKTAIFRNVGWCISGIQEVS